MGKGWDSTGIAFQKETWELAFQLLKPGGHLLAFSGSRTYHRMAVAIEDAGFEIRDQIMWLYGSGFPKSLNVGEGWGTALKPAHEPVVMARKPLEGTNKQNIEKYGTGGINIDDCRLSLGQTQNVKRRKVVRKSRSKDGVWTNKNSGMKAEGAQFADADPRGRFPANVLHDGLQESWARYFYCAKTSKSERDQGLDNLPIKKASSMPGHRNAHDMKDYKIDNDVTGRFVTERKNIHPTVKPIKLMKYLCRLITPKGGTVLDPFMGSGSTGKAAVRGGFDFVGIEMEKEYMEIATARIQYEQDNPYNEEKGERVEINKNSNKFW